MEDHDVEGREGGIGHYYGVDYHAGHEHAFGTKRVLVEGWGTERLDLPLRTIAHGENELGTD